MTESKLYKTILADPPWPERGSGRVKRGADRHYKLMSVEEIREFGCKVGPYIDTIGCHLYLWVTNNYLPDGIDVLRNWGFRYITCITWGKEGKIGLGQYFRGKTEHLLFGSLGHLPYKKTADGKRCQGQTLLLSPRGKHSEKPAAARRMIEVVSYEPRLELFARGPRVSGWDCWGKECESSVLISAT